VGRPASAAIRTTIAESPQPQNKRGHGRDLMAGFSAQFTVQERKRASMTAANADVVLDNDRVTVRRVKHSGPGPVSSARRADRLVVYLKDAHIARTEGGRREDIIRRAGDVVWRPSSEHDIELMEDSEHEVLIIELKP